MHTHKLLFYLLTYPLIIFLFFSCQDISNSFDEGTGKVNVTVKPAGGKNIFLEIIDLGQYGLKSAVDINNKGQIVGGNLLWEKQEGLTEMGDLSASAINNHGQVVGHSTSSRWQAFYWDKVNGIIEIDTLDYSDEIESSSRVYDIDDHGHVVGEVDEYSTVDYSYDFISMIWDKENGIIRTFEWYSTAFNINNFDQITGAAYLNPPSEIYLYEMDAGFTALGPFDGYDYGRPSAINDKKQIVGSIAALQENTYESAAKNINHLKQKDVHIIDKLLRMTNTLGIYDFGHVVEMIQKSRSQSKMLSWNHNPKFEIGNLNSSETSPFRNMKEQNQIVESALSSEYRSVAFIWDDQTGLTSLGTLGGKWSTAWDINNLGQVVGYSSIAPGAHRAFYWDKENGIIELPTLGGNSLAKAINDHGQIVGYSYDSNGQIHPVMWRIELIPKILSK